MQRDMDLVRAILLALEKHEHGFAPQEVAIPGYSEEQVGFHVHLLGQAGLLETLAVTSLADPSPNAVPGSITWQGYEFLDAARSESLWKKAGAQVAKAGLSMSLDIVKPLLINLAKQQLGLPSV